LPDQTPKIFVGAGEKSRVELAVLEHSIARHAHGPYELFAFNGTTGQVSRDGQVVFERGQLAPVQGHRFATEFSLFRYIIPELCGYTGRAVYLDSDMVCFADVAALAATPLPNGAWFAARKNAYPEIGPDRYALSVMVMDCARCRFDLPAIFKGITGGKYTYTHFSQMEPRFLRHFPIPIEPLDDAWNSFDFRDASTKLIHYTDLERQPWRFPFHPHGQVWHEYMLGALESGRLDRQVLNDALAKGHVRADLMAGPDGEGRGALAGPLFHARLVLRDWYRWAGYRAGWIAR
jgi:hypothetical protein